MTTARMSLGHRLLAGQHREAALLDVEREHVDLVVAVDERLRGGEVEVEQGVGAPRDRSRSTRAARRMRSRWIVVELLVERRARLGHRRVLPDLGGEVGGLAGDEVAQPGADDGAVVGDALEGAAGRRTRPSRCARRRGPRGAGARRRGARSRGRGCRCSVASSVARPRSCADQARSAVRNSSTASSPTVSSTSQTHPGARRAGRARGRASRPAARGRRRARARR